VNNERSINDGKKNRSNVVHTYAASVYAHKMPIVARIVMQIHEKTAHGLL
jgi:hypothetical protein